MGLASNALIEVNTLSSFLGKKQDSISLPTERLELLINMASKFVDNYTNRKWRPAVVGGVETRDGNGQFRIFAHQPNLSSFTLAYWGGSSFTNIPSSWTTNSDADKYMIWFTDGNVFHKGNLNWRITYSYGYDIGDVPFDMQQICCILVQRFLMSADGKEGTTSESFSEHTVSFDLSKLPMNLKMYLDMNRRPTFG